MKRIDIAVLVVLLWCANTTSADIYDDEYNEYSAYLKSLSDEEFRYESKAFFRKYNSHRFYVEKSEAMRKERLLRTDTRFRISGKNNTRGNGQSGTRMGKNIGLNHYFNCVRSLRDIVLKEKYMQRPGGKGMEPTYIEIDELEDIEGDVFVSFNGRNEIRHGKEYEMFDIEKNVYIDVSFLRDEIFNLIENNLPPSNCEKRFGVFDKGWDINSKNELVVDTVIEIELRNCFLKSHLDWIYNKISVIFTPGVDKNGDYFIKSKVLVTSVDTGKTLFGDLLGAVTFGVTDKLHDFIDMFITMAVSTGIKQRAQKNVVYLDGINKPNSKINSSMNFIKFKKDDPKFYYNEQSNDVILGVQEKAPTRASAVCEVRDDIIENIGSQ